MTSIPGKKRNLNEADRTPVRTQPRLKLNKRLVLRMPPNFGRKSPSVLSNSQATSEDPKEETKSDTKSQISTEADSILISSEKPEKLSEAVLKAPESVKTEEQQTESSMVEEEEEEESDSDESMSMEVRQELYSLVKSFPGLSSRYKLIDKIGEGTFSTVYKAYDLQRVSETSMGHTLWSSPPAKNRVNKPTHKLDVPVVALKRIYVTSSPSRIYNELQLLHSLVGCPNVAPLIDAIRYEDQVIAVLPFYKHADFRDFYRDIPLSGIKIYMHELFTALSFVHEKKIIHRDIKPTNFLYNPLSRKGVLVDFGLAEKEAELDYSACPCFQGGASADEIAPANAFPAKGYLKDDRRPGRRANRAGTRGFRAPEVLLKCANQTVKVDIWSAGVMLLTLLSRRFPFFNSTDDTAALVEITSIFGLNQMRKCSQLHGLGLESNLPKIESVQSLGALLYTSILLEAKQGDTLADDSPAWELLSALDKKGRPLPTKLGTQYGDALELLELCLKLNHNERITADQALKLPFFKSKSNDADDIILD
ncbi:hypothetical protein OGAPHI_000217 [Ogataea philodendri]|uniref:non-specific serine/threonine protein kinase n=1 Tax=Ogataea philodendri TaxID=1378263 RepID=A0A9P8PHI9_9ASCO|nr:uncharacterized protein OGAPHI_000217 [Ogataea philodendri]KAH3671514.1 hypothetical protein OGAPHI_000217 [Ogataea philodendri]